MRQLVARENLWGNEHKMPNQICISISEEILLGEELVKVKFKLQMGYFWKLDIMKMINDQGYILYISIIFPPHL